MTDFKAGDKVRIKSLGKKGIINEIMNDYVKVAVNAVNFHIAIKDLEKLNESEKPTISPSAITISRGKNIISIDLHGLTTEQSIKALERDLNRAFLDRNCCGLEVIHGKGREIIKKAVKSFFKDKNLAVRLTEDLHNTGKTTIWLE